MQTNRIEQTAQRHIDDGAFASIEWLVERGGKTWQQCAVGMADPLNGVALPDNPIYRIYSMTKPVVSALAMMLIEEGRLHLANPLTAYVPEFSGQKVLDAGGEERRSRTQIIIAHLMTHTSGLSYGFLPSCPVAKLYRADRLTDNTVPLAELVKSLAQYPLAFEPGSQWRYSVATDVLGRVVEVVEGKPLQQVMRERIIRPLSLQDTDYRVSDGSLNRLMPMFGNANIDELMKVAPGPQELTPGDVSKGYPSSDPNFARGGHGLFSTAADYMIIARFLATGKAPSGDTLLSRKAVELMWANRLPDTLRPLSIGLIQLPGYGFSLAGRAMVEPGIANVFSSKGEHGWSGAASTYFIIDPAEDLIAVIMSQYLGSKIRLADDIQNAIYAML